MADKVAGKQQYEYGENSNMVLNVDYSLLDRRARGEPTREMMPCESFSLCFSDDSLHLPGDTAAVTTESEDGRTGTAVAKTVVTIEPGFTLKGQFRCDQRLQFVSPNGQSEIWRGRDLKTRMAVVVKFQPEPSANERELHAITELNRSSPVHILLALDHGSLNVQSAAPLFFLVLPHVGVSIRALQGSIPTKRFTLSTALRLLILELHAVREMHDAGWLHCNLSPAHFILGHDIRAGRQNRLYLIDLSMARPWRTEEYAHRSNADGAIAIDNLHRQVIHDEKHNKSRSRANPSYASLTASTYCDMSRRDDIWSLLYMAVEYVLGVDAYPWYSTLTDVPNDLTSEVKRDTVPKCVERFPCLVKWHARLLRTERYDRPDYDAFEADIIYDLQACDVSSGTAYDWEDNLAGGQTNDVN